MKTIKYLICFMFVVCCFSCSANKHDYMVDYQEETTMVTRVLPNVLIYKTKQDYSKQVPILMNADKTQIISYPAPSDLCPGGSCFYPTLLSDGFWLDNRGIGKNVVFLSYTYEAYASLPTAPSLKELMESIIDKEPLTALYNCGKSTDFKNLVDELNVIIESKRYEEIFNSVL